MSEKELAMRVSDVLWRGHECGGHGCCCVYMCLGYIMKW